MLIDTPPVLAVADTVVIAPQAGTVFLVARTEQSTLGELRESHQAPGGGVQVRAAHLQRAGPEQATLWLRLRYMATIVYGYKRYGYKYQAYQYKNSQKHDPTTPLALTWLTSLVAAYAGADPALAWPTQHGRHRRSAEVPHRSPRRVLAACRWCWRWPMP